MTSLSSVEPPAPGTRPKDRRAITVRAAAELFSRRGYQQVSVAEIARATNVGSSAIFRHFPTKAELLVAATRRPLAGIMRILTDAAAEDREPTERLGAVLPLLAEFALDHRETGVLWQREARVLEGADQDAVRQDLRGISHTFADLIRQQRPTLAPDRADLLAWCAMGVLVSVGFHAADPPRDRYVALLVELVRAVTDLELPATLPASTARKAPRSTSRRDVLLSEATRLFAEKGFGTVGVDDIGTAVGIAGPSIYTYFPSKQQLLRAVVERGSLLLRTEADAALAQDIPPAAKLDLLVRSWIDLALRDRFLLRLVLSEIRHLEDDDREYARQQQRDYIDTWTTLLLEVTGGDPVEARIRVQAVFLVVNDAAQTSHLRGRPELGGILGRLATALLGLPDAS